MRERTPENEEVHAALIDPDDEFGEDTTKELVALEGDELDTLTAEESAIHLVAEP